MVVLHLLQLNDEKLTYLQLIGMARGVASGMVYLSAMNFIHRVMKIFCLKYVNVCTNFSFGANHIIIFYMPFIIIQNLK